MLTPCPYCGGQPDVAPCESRPKKSRRASWYAVCYKRGDTPAEEHCVGVNGATREKAEENWAAECRRLLETYRTK